MGAAGELPGEVPGVGAHRHPPGPGRRGQARQGAAQQPRRGRARVISAVAQVSGQHDLGLGPGRDVRPPDPLPLMVIGHAAFLAAVDLHISGVQVDRDRAISQRHGSLRRKQRQHPAGHRRQAGLHRLPLRRSKPAGQPRRGGGRQARHRRDLLACRIGALAVQPGQEVLPGQLRRRNAGQQLPGSQAAIPLLDRADRRIQRIDHAQPAAQLGDRGQARVRRQRPIRRADQYPLTPQTATTYPAHQIGVLSAGLTITWQRSSSQDRAAPIGIYRVASTAYSRNRV